MKELRHAPDDVNFLRGIEAGHTWGRRAQPAELENVQRLFEGISQDPAFTWDGYFYEGGTAAPLGVAEQLALEIVGVSAEDVDVREEVTAFWNEALGSYEGNADLKNPAFLQGFADGALEIWDKVKLKS